MRPACLSRKPQCLATLRVVRDLHTSQYHTYPHSSITHMAVFFTTSIMIAIALAPKPFVAVFGALQRGGYAANAACTPVSVSMQRACV